MDTATSFNPRPLALPNVPRLVRPLLAALAPLALTATLLASVTPAFAASSPGTLVFYPCARCHPVGAAGVKTPIPFPKHQVRLEIHDVLGKGDEACLVCHESPAKDPGRLRLVGGGTVLVTGDVSRLCFGCHSQKYAEWKAGMHGRAPSCVTQGCHDPHTPGWIGIAPLTPFLGTTIETRILPQRVPFTALPPAPAPPPVETPPWLSLIAGAGAVLGLTLGGGLIVERMRG